MYPNGATSQGLLDMTGNVWEWCLNKYDDPEKSASLCIDDSDASRVVRGGSWNFKPVGLRASYRFWVRAVLRFYDLGCRLVQDIDE
jgi:formylglycine-generating enzyme required for sulfatase activity